MGQKRAWALTKLFSVGWSAQLGINERFRDIKSCRQYFKFVLDAILRTVSALTLCKDFWSVIVLFLSSRREAGEREN